MGQTLAMAKTLTVFLAADVSKLTRQLNTAKGDVTGFGNGINGLGDKLKNMLGPALIGAGIAAGAFAVKLGVDGVKAALEDAASIDKLTQTLENLNLAHQLPEVENAISKFERTLGIADTELRPAYDRLVRSIGNTQEATRILGIALDVSAGSGKSLDAVVQALGKAYDGNTAGLSKLGAGIDSATLKTGDLDLITSKLAATFGGQATTAAQTMEGQLRVLQTAAENVTEAFGTGLLGALGDTNDQTTDLVSTMEELEPAIQNLGETVGETLIGVLDIANALIELDTRANEVIDSFGPLRFVVDRLFPTTRALEVATNAASFAMGALGEEADALPGSLSGTVLAALDGSAALKSMAISAGILDDSLSELADKPSTAFYQVLAQINKGAVQSNYSMDRFDKTIQSTGSSATSTASSIEKLNKDIEETSPAYEAATKRVELSKDALDAETQSLENATQKRKDYVNSLVGQITAGFDLGAGFAMKDGEVDGSAWVAGVEGQLAQTEWFGNVLEAVKRSDATNGEALAQYLAKQGIEKGAVWGQALLDQGLVPTMAAKLQQAVDSAALVANAMAEPFTEAGDMAAINTIDGIIGTLENERATLRQIGKNIGRPIGARIKEEIAEAVAGAIAAAAAARTAALAEVSAREAAQNAIAVEQATSQSIARLIRNSDNRAGRNVQPVLT